MNITSRLKNIELKFSRKHGEQEIIVLTEENGKYYREQNGQKIETKLPEDDPNKLVIFITREPYYEMQKDIK